MNEKTKKLLNLYSRLTNERDMIGWLCTMHQNRVIYPNNPDATRRIQEQLNHASGLVSLVYIFALLEEGDFFSEGIKLISPEKKLELLAWKHIRHTGAHAPGGRASSYYSEFNKFMKSSEPGLSGLKQNCTFTDVSISLNPVMSWKFYEFVSNLVQSTVSISARKEPVAPVFAFSYPAILLITIGIMVFIFGWSII